MVSCNRDVLHLQGKPQRRVLAALTDSSLWILQYLDGFNPGRNDAISHNGFLVAFINACSCDLFQALLVLSLVIERSAENPDPLWDVVFLVHNVDNFLNTFMANADPIGDHLKSLIAVSVVFRPVNIPHANAADKSQEMDRLQPREKLLHRMTPFASPRVIQRSLPVAVLQK